MSARAYQFAAAYYERDSLALALQGWDLSVYADTSATRFHSYLNVDVLFAIKAFFDIRAY